MRNALIVVGAFAIAAVAVFAQPMAEATCKACSATYISNDELDAYARRAVAKGLNDQQVRSVDIGKSGVAVGLVFRKKMDAPPPNAVAEHHLVSEVYHVMSGSATLVTGPHLVGARPRPATNENVRMLNGPGANAASIQDGVTHQLKAGDVIVIPAGTGHWFTRVDSDLTYLMVRIDPDKVVPGKDEAASRAYLATP